MMSRKVVETDSFTTYLIGSSPKLLDIIEIIRKISNTPTNILIYGESGTGKELAARTIHLNSNRKNNQFIDLNCAALPESILESELFGIEKGVATGVEKRIGKIELSDGGTLFLDEIGDLSLNAQAKLLRVIQERKLTRVGGKDVIHVDLRIIAATNKNLVDEIKNSNFREDLFYRINEVNFKLPPLRERRDDIIQLSNYFLENFRNELNIPEKMISNKVKEYIINYNWPGNVRELRNEIKRAAILSENKIIETDDLSATIVEYFKGNNSNSTTLKDAVSELEIKMIIEALEKTNGNKKKASEILGITRQGLLKKIKRHNIEEYYSRQKHKKISEKLVSSSNFVGRTDELNLLINLINSDEPEFFIVYIHGIGGIGKTFLIKSVLKEIDAEINIINLNCLDIEPTEEGFLNTLSENLAQKIINLDELIGYLEKETRKTVFILDNYENFNLLDTWIRNKFIPSLPTNFLTIIISRQAPNMYWFSNSGLGTYFKEIGIEELSLKESLELLKSREIRPQEAEKIYSLVHGHPLSLELALNVVRKNPKIKLQRENFPNVFNTLTKIFFEGLNSNLRKSIEALSITRRFDENYLRYLEKNTDLKIPIDELVELPFLELTTEGYRIHQLIRESIAVDLKIRDQIKFNKLKKLAFQYYVDISKNLKNRKLWQLTADLLYLIENPVVRNAFFPPGSSEFVVEKAIETDFDDIIRIAAQSESAEIIDIYKNWIEELPGSFNVVRDILGKVEAFFILCEDHEPNSKLISKDPLLRLWLDHIQNLPVKNDEKVLFLRRWLSNNHGENPCDAQASSWLDVKRNYMELRPDLRRLYTTVKNINIYAPIITPLRFKPINNSEITIDNDTFYSAYLDFGNKSVDGWLQNLIGEELSSISIQ